jgi:cytochrome c peroxidase
VQRGNDITDYMNWYEATQVRTYSGAFDSYLKTARDLDREDAERKKNDPISRYLDTLEKEFQDAAPVGSR